jgi:ABC-type multidrug transport system fused ATPase/permease subunit
MAGEHLWFSIVTSSYLLAITFCSDLALLIIPSATYTSLISLSAHFGITFIALLTAFTTPSGPHHVITTSEGTFNLAPVGRKGRSIVSILYFTPAFPLIKAAKRKGQIDETDTSLLGSDLSANVLHLHFSTMYEKAKGESTPRWVPTETLRGCWPLLRTIVMANPSLIINVVFWSAVAGLCFYAPAFVTFQIISFLEQQEQAGNELSGVERLRQGLPYCVLLAASMFLPTMMMSQVVTLAIQWLRNRIRIQLNTAIFAKALRRKDASGKKATGDKEGEDKDDGSNSKSQIVNLASVDSERISMVIYLITFGMAPAEILLGGFFSIKLLGWGAVIGLSASILLQPIIFYLGKLEASYSSTQQSTRDRKTSLLNEVLQAIRMIKFNAWESQTSARVESVRREELKDQRILFLLDTAQVFISTVNPIVVILVSYGWYTLVEKKPLTPAVAFTAMTVLQEMRFALSSIPDSIAQVIQALVSVQRIQTYLESEEVEIPQLGQKKGVYMKDASVQWPQLGSKKDVDAFSLQSISVDFTKDALNLVVGKIGSGKTLLLRALLGEADVVQGSVSCPRSLPSSIGEPCPKNEQGWLREDQCCYVPQTAFLINASVKENILFGLPLIESRYQSTLDACGLLPDLKLLEDGDETEIGENGIGLSGGQKIRVTLARAAYGRGATVLLDDCLSAVDAHTADHIYKNLLQGPLFFNRTVILVTHQVQLVAQSADRIVMLEEGSVRFQGEALTFLNSDLYHGLIEDQQDSVESKIELLSEDVTPATTAPPSPQSSVKSLLKDDITATPIKAPPRQLVKKEERAKGAVLMSIYARYITAAGGMSYAIILIIVFALATAFTIVTSRWLQYWSSDVLQGRQSHTNLWWISIWAALWAVDVALIVLKNLLLYYGSLRASEKLFTAMLNAILLAPLRFHDTVSRGRLLNRFSSDFAEADSQIAGVFQRVGDQIIVTLASISVVTSGSGYIFIVAIAVMSPVYILVGRLYMIAARDMKRLASTTRSPIISTFSDVVSGVSVIRAFGGSNHFFANLTKRIEFNVTFLFWSNQLRWWYEQIFTALSFCLILLAAIIILLNPSIGAARAGFVFSFLTEVHHHLLFLLQAYSNMEQTLVSVERIVEYTALEPEVSKSRIVVPAAWPSSASVEIQDLKVRYSSELPDVIKGITVTIPGGTKVGVVGPTGCGKSTLASSFFRFVETSGGSISIDGVDIANVPLKDLRSRLQIVPQDPIILSGPLRSSVDVQDEFSDEQVRQALRDVQLLKETSEGTSTPSQSNKHDLDYEITEGGGNLSNGEKQLLCLARAILRRSKLIIFDEATSSVDFDTDQAISQTIQNAFKDSTIITIAHRLRTIIDYDLVMVMDDGKVVEFDSPIKLLGDSSTRFHR